MYQHCEFKLSSGGRSSFHGSPRFKRYWRGLLLAQEMVEKDNCLEAEDKCVMLALWLSQRGRSNTSILRETKIKWIKKQLVYHCDGELRNVMKDETSEIRR